MIVACLKVVSRHSLGGLRTTMKNLI